MSRQTRGLASAVAATATAATVAATTTAAATPAAVFARLGFVDGQRTPIVLLLMQAGDGLASRVVIRHFHETKALAAAGIAVLDDLRAAHRAELREQFFERRVGDVVTQVSDVQLLSHL